MTKQPDWTAAMKNWGDLKLEIDSARRARANAVYPKYLEFLAWVPEICLLIASNGVDRAVITADMADANDIPWPGKDHMNAILPVLQANNYNADVNERGELVIKFGRVTAYS